MRYDETKIIAKTRNETIHEFVAWCEAKTAALHHSAGEPYRTAAAYWLGQIDAAPEARK